MWGAYRFGLPSTRPSDAAREQASAGVHLWRPVERRPLVEDQLVAAVLFPFHCWHLQLLHHCPCHVAPHSRQTSPSNAFLRPSLVHERFWAAPSATMATVEALRVDFD